MCLLYIGNGILESINTIGGIGCDRSFCGISIDCGGGSGIIGFIGFTAGFYPLSALAIIDCILGVIGCSVCEGACWLSIINTIMRR